jgi:transcriptional regulator with XRE-family HTH domain
MDGWQLKAWRKQLRYSQSKAGEKLGLSRATIQNWESKRVPIPYAVELACMELTRRWKQRPEFGPVTLVYPDSPLWQEACDPYHFAVLHCEHFPNNLAAIEQACRFVRMPNFIQPLIIDEDGTVIWSGQDLISECDRRATMVRREKK